MHSARRALSRTRSLCRCVASTSAAADNLVVPMISEQLRQHLFKGRPMQEPYDDALEAAVGRYAPLRDGSLDMHFRRAAKTQSDAYDVLLSEFAERNVPQLPESKWRLEAGWTAYRLDEEGQWHITTVAHPPDDALVFDVETLSTEGPLPVMATAVGADTWYAWLSARLLDEIPESLPKFWTDIKRNLIPFGVRKKCPRILIGHNVGFDRARIDEPYMSHVRYCLMRIYEIRLPQESATRYWDTMAVHIAMCGMEASQYQDYARALKMRETRRAVEKELGEKIETVMHRENTRGELLLQNTSKAALTDAHAFHCNVEHDAKVDKTLREVFVKGTLNDVRNNAIILLDYCALDTRATHDLHAATYSKFKRKFTHPVTLAGMLTMGTTRLPVDNSWYRFKRKCDEEMTAREKNSRKIFVDLVRDKVESKRTVQEQLSDPWTWWFDWTPRRDVATYRWCMHLLNPKAATTTRVSLVPSLLGLCWRGSPLLYMDLAFLFYRIDWELLNELRERYGENNVRIKFIPPTDGKMTPMQSRYYNKYIPIWHIARVMERSGEEEKETKKEETLVEKAMSIEVRDGGEWQPLMDDRFCNLLRIVKVPHPDRQGASVGAVITESMVPHINSGALHTYEDCMSKYLHSLLYDNTSTTLWRNMRARVGEQIAAVHDDDEMPMTAERYGAIVPQLCVAGTLTRRAVDKLWQVAANPTKDAISSEIKAIVRTPPDQVFVGADVDSQEQWIAGSIGDAYAHKVQHTPEDRRTPGVTPFTKMLLSGRKEDGTDMHSLTARLLNISRDNAKTLNYARLYGAGQRHSAALLRRCQPNYTEREAAEKVDRLFKETKGTRWSRIQFDGQLRNLFTSKEFAEYAKSGSSNKMAKFAWTGKDHVFMRPSGMAPHALMAFLRFLIDRGYVKGIRKRKIRQALEEKGYISGRVAATLLNDGLEQQSSTEARYITGDYTDGTESAMFNGMEEIANASIPLTPALKCPMSDALTVPASITQRRQDVAQEMIDSLTTTRVNWVVQSSAVDFLHLLLVQMRYLLDEWRVDSARFVVSIHDELRYSCAEADAPLVALALHLTNLYARAYFTQQLGMNNLPSSCATFSEVDVDYCLRKSVDATCETPSCPGGVERCYGTPFGRVLPFNKCWREAWPLLEARYKKANASSDTREKRQCYA